MGATIPARGAGGPQYAAELRILLVYLSKSLGRLGQNGGHWGATFFIGGGGGPLPPVEPLLMQDGITNAGKRQYYYGQLFL